MHRFYLPDGMPPEGPAQLPREVARQISRVLRMRPGEEIGVFDGTGVQWTLELDEVSSRHVEGHVTDVARPATEPAIEITLYQSLIDAAQFELVLQKGVELGVAQFVPVVTERARGAGSTGASESRRSRWARIVQEAAEQSGRVVVPDVDAPRTLVDVVAKRTGGQLIVPWEEETSMSLRDALRSRNDDAETRIDVLIGPKGGLSVAEIELLKESGATPVTLGSRILRAETAAIATVSAILYELGELGNA